MKRSLVVVVVVAMLVATPGAGAAVAGVLDGGSETDDGALAADPTASQADQGEVTVSTGSQLSTVLSTTEDEVSTGVSQSVFETRFEAGNESERAAAVADRAATLTRQSREIAAEYRNATAAYRNGTLDRSAYAQRLATLHARAENVQSSIDDLRDRAANVSDLALETAGLNETALDAAESDLDAVSGAGPEALLERFTGQTNGSVSLEARDGVTVDVESEGGERSREVRGPTDDDESMTVDQGAALETARAALSVQPANWTLRESSVHHDSGYYEFEFGYVTANETAEAEVRVDGSTGDVFRIEEEMEPRDDDEGPDDRDEDDVEARQSGGDIALLVVSGDPAPGATLTLEARQNGAAAPNASVWVDDAYVGTTNDDGRIDVTLTGAETEIRAERGDAGTELEFEFDVGESELPGLNVSASLTDGTVSVTVTYQGDGVDRAQVEADGDFVGTTGADGTVSFPHDGSSELEVAITRGELELERTYHVENGSLVQGEASDDDGDDESDGGSEGDGDGRPDSLDLVVVGGDPAPNATITLETRHNGSAVPNATILVDDERVGTTDDEGRITVTLGANETEITAEHRGADTELEFEFDDESDGDESENGDDGTDDGDSDDGDDGTDSDAELDVSVVAGDPGPNETVTVRATLGDSPAAGADVLVDDEPHGTTDSNGEIAVTLNPDDTEITVEYRGKDAELEFDFD